MGIGTRVIPGVCVVYCLVSLWLGAPAGCTQGQPRYKPAFLASRADIAAYVRDALEHPSADVRRQAIQQIVQTNHADLPLVIDAFSLIARTDTSESVRCAAVRALAGRDAPQAVETMIAILGAAAGQSGVRAAGARLRWEAMQVLHARAQAGKVPETMRLSVRDIGMDRLNGDPSRDVRLTAAKLLGYDADVASVRALIGALWQNDFGVQYEAERSLMRLTGVTHNHDPTEWSRWIEATAEPFAQRGALDDRLDGRRKGLWPFAS